jgi:hypothetical protein
VIELTKQQKAGLEQLSQNGAGPEGLPQGIELPPPSAPMPVAQKSRSGSIYAPI